MMTVMMRPQIIPMPPYQRSIDRMTDCGLWSSTRIMEFDLVLKQCRFLDSLTVDMIGCDAMKASQITVTRKTMIIVHVILDTKATNLDIT